MQNITTDHKLAIALARENIEEFTADMRRLYLLLGAIVDQLEPPDGQPGTAAALASIARDWILRDAQLEEARACIAHLERDFPLPEAPL